MKTNTAYLGRAQRRVRPAPSQVFSAFREFENVLIDFISFREIGAKRAAREFADSCRGIKNSFDCFDIPETTEE